MQGDFLMPGGKNWTCPLYTIEIEGYSPKIRPVRFGVELGKITRMIEIRRGQGTPELFATPGFINCHVHWAMPGDRPLENILTFVAGRKDEQEEVARENTRKALRVGITTVCDKGPPISGPDAPWIYSIVKDLERTGIAPRTFFSAWTVGAFGGFAESACRKVTTEEEVDELITDFKRAGAHIIKIIPEGGYPEYDFVFGGRRLEVLTRKAHENNLLVSMHAKGQAAILAGIEYGVDCIDHGIKLAEIASPRVLQYIRTCGIFLGPTLEGLLCRREGAITDGRNSEEPCYEWNHVVLTFQKTAKDLAGNLLFTSDAGSEYTPHGSLKELYLMRLLGLEPAAIFRAATVNGAKFLRLGSKFGALKENYIADMVLWFKNPLDLPLEEWEHLEKYIAAVILNGKIVVSHIN